MNEEDVRRTLMLMEQIREMSYEADTRAEERRLVREYKRLWESVQPYLPKSEGQRP